MLAEKSWSKDFERSILGEWKDFAFHDSGKPVFSIDTPPPYVNTPIHIGHAAVYSVMDMIARFRRMAGWNVLFPLGLDRNGLPIEMAAEKRFGVTLHDVSRERFLEMCRTVLEEASSESADSLKRLGISFNSWRESGEIGGMYYTDSAEFRAMTQATFADLWNKGLIYEDSRVNNYCPGCRTTLADAEIDYEEIPSLFSSIIFRVKESGEDIVIGTTRPELIATCAMVIFNPEDERYKHMEGKTAITPLFDREVPIRAHPLADMSKGTGLMMMCSFGDQADIRFFREHNIAPAIAINADGMMNENAGFLAGMKVADARKNILDELKERGLVVKQQQIVHRTPVCERSKHQIEFIAMPELYLRQVEFKDALRGIAEQLNFFSERSRVLLLDWIESVSIDWPLSRRRYYGTEVPLWYCECGKIILPEAGRYVQPWREQPKKECPECGRSQFRGDQRVFDTWFDSAGSPLYILKWMDGDFFSKTTPCSLRPQGKEIVRNWLYYTLLKCWLLTGDTIFRDVWIHHHIVDDTGRKMSKRLGNVIDPKDVLGKYGSDSFRFWCAAEGNLDSSDLKCSYGRIEAAGRTLTKLWNVAKFVSQFEVSNALDLQAADFWIMKEINDLITFAYERYTNYDFHNPAIRIRTFLWETFASHYVELVKSRAYNKNRAFSEAEQNAAIFSLRYCLENLLRLLAPVTPFITYKIYYDVFGKDVHEEDFPAAPRDYASPVAAADVFELNSAVWAAKKAKGKSLKDSVSVLTLHEKFRPLEKDIAACHNVKEIRYADHIGVEM